MKSTTTNTKTNGAQLWQESAQNPSHSKTRLPDYHDSAANVTNPPFYSVSLPADL